MEKKGKKEKMGNMGKMEKMGKWVTRSEERRVGRV